MTRYTPLWLQAGSYPAGVDRRLIAAIWPAAVVSGCAVTVQANMNLNVAAGSVVVPAANNSGSVLCVSDAVEVVTLGTAPGAGTNRIDVVCCSVTSTDIGTAAGDAFSFTAIAGTPSASPVAPAVPAGSVAVAQVLVIGGQASIQAGNITDRRPPGPGVAVPAGSALVTQTDSSGVLWVAKGGVNGGAWVQARDALHARVYRTGAWTTSTTTPPPFTFDTVQRDPYALYTAGATSAFTVPAPGVYLVSALLASNPGTGACAMVISNVTYGVINGTPPQNDLFGQVKMAASGSMYLAAGATVAVTFQSQTAVAGAVGNTNTWFSIDYLGAG